MKYEAKNSPFNVILIAVCSFVGVGFITGAEIWFYFARFGKNMIFSAIHKKDCIKFAFVNMRCYIYNQILNGPYYEY